MKRIFHLVAVFILVLSGCGYHLRGSETNLPPEIQSVAIPIFGNNTTQTGIEAEVTRALVDRFISSRRLPVNGSASADAILSGTVLLFTTSPVAVTSSTQVSTEYRATLTVQFIFKDQKTGRILFRETMNDWRTYPVVNDLNATEQNKLAAIRQISVLLADKIYELVLGGF
ncbi:MAG TPA: LPS assembly lipoprotein LptE [Thermodesulfobacteriota bacterium]|nr:LPS assembly lipoprotein LptE [Thermodesulfobacteriota bacterium]